MLERETRLLRHYYARRVNWFGRFEMGIPPTIEPHPNKHLTNVFAISRAFEQLLRPEMATGGGAEDKAWTWKKRKTRLAANTSRSILADPRPKSG